MLDKMHLVLSSWFLAVLFTIHPDPCVHPIHTVFCKCLSNSELSVQLFVCPVDRRRCKHAVGLLFTGCQSMLAACHSLATGSRYWQTAAGARAQAVARLSVGGVAQW